MVEEKLWLSPDPPELNFCLTMGEEEAGVAFEFQVAKNPLNKIKWWLFCKFFPFRVTKWDKLNK